VCVLLCSIRFCAILRGMDTQYEMIRLQEVCRQKGALCTGLDTDPSYIPPEVLRGFEEAADAVLAYNMALIEATAPFSACFKVQVAYYEAMGLVGMKTYAATLAAVRGAGIPVIADVKRGDIAATADAYARAHFSGDFEADIITINPYMGFDTLVPFIDVARKKGKGIFVLLRTSNPGMVDIEKLPLATGGIVVDRVGQELARINAEYVAGADGFACGRVGAVVGCTEESDARSIRDAYPNMFFLIPGYGAQGGAARIAAVLLDKAGGTVNNSRGILCAWKKSESLAEKREAGILTLDDIVSAAADAAKASQVELLSAKALIVAGN